MRIDPGFDPNHVLLSQLYLSTNGYTLAQRKEFCRRLTERMESAPGVTDVAYSDGVPLGFEPSWWEELQDRRLRAAARRKHEHLPQRDLAGVSAAAAHTHRGRPQLYRSGQRKRARGDDCERGVCEAILRRAQSDRARDSWVGRLVPRRGRGQGLEVSLPGRVSDALLLRAVPAGVSRGHEPGRSMCARNGDPDSILSTLRTQARAIDPQRDRLRCRAAEGVYRRIALSAEGGGEPDGGAWAASRCCWPRWGCTA